MVDLVSEGWPVGRIVLPPQPAPVERHAAEELQKYHQAMSGAKLSIAHCPGRDRANVYLGAAAATEGLDLSERALGYDG